MVRKHSSEAFYALDDPLEAAVFSVLVEMVKKMDENERSAKASICRQDWAQDLTGQEYGKNLDTYISSVHI